MILFVFEGEKKEPAVVDALADWIGVAVDRVESIYGTHIYKLYSAMQPDVDLDVFATLQELVKDNTLDSYSRNDFSEIYLFFDYDAHVPMPYVGGLPVIGDDVIGQMLHFFNDESENGLLYLSYPMAEAIQHYRDESSFKTLTAKCKGVNCISRSECVTREECIKEPHYKDIVNKYAPQLSIITRVKPAKWAEIIAANLKKMNYLMSGIYSFPESRYSQMEIFLKQLTLVAQECPHVAVLSGFAPFLADYLGLDKVRQKIEYRLRM